MMRITLCVPSRGRPADLKRLVMSATFAAARPANVEVVAVLDDDDPALSDYLRYDDEIDQFVVGERGVLSDYWNRAAAVATGNVFMLAADDIVFRTPGWDEAVGLAFERAHHQIALVYGRDGIADERMATHPFIHRHWYDAVGYFTPSGFPADYVDLWLHDVADMIHRLRYLPTVYIEHLHYSVGKSPMDATHTERLARAAAMDLPAMYADRLHERRDAAMRLSAVL